MNKYWETAETSISVLTFKGIANAALYAAEALNYFQIRQWKNKKPINYNKEISH